MLSRPICAEEQPSKPSADDGDTRTPSGNVTATFFTCDGDKCVTGSSFCGTVRSN